MSKLRPLAVGAASAALVVTSALFPAATAAADVTEYVALGDSYSSGTGTGDFIDDGTSCLRSEYAYGSLLAAARGYDLNLRACSGAVVSDVINSQVPALSSSTDIVTISIGGNDAGFASVLTECAKPGWMSNCNGAIDTAENIISGRLPGRLGNVYSAISSAAPNAEVVVVGYPRIFMGEDCNALTWFSPAEQARLNSVADQLSGTIQTAASAAGFTYRSVIPAFVGHAVCDDPEWLNGLSWPIEESYHPNKTGHAQGYLPVVSGAVTGSSITADADLLAKAEANKQAMADKQRQYADLDAHVTPKKFSKPDLTTPQARAAAAKAGVDLASKVSIDRVDHAFSVVQAKAVGLGSEMADAVVAGADAAVDTGKKVVTTAKDAGKTAVDSAGAWAKKAWQGLGG